MTDDVCMAIDEADAMHKQEQRDTDLCAETPGLIPQQVCLEKVIRRVNIQIHIQMTSDIVSRYGCLRAYRSCA